MNSNVEQHLRDLLFENESVAIPGLGILQTYYTSASIDKEGGRVHPPSKKLRFEEDTHGDGDELINRIVEREGKSTFEARLKVEEFVEYMRAESRLADGFAMKGVGTFRANSLSAGISSLDFDPDPDANFNIGTYGMDAARLPGDEITPPKVESTIEEMYPPSETDLNTQEPKSVSEFLEARRKAERENSEETTDYLDELREEFERKKREDELKRRAGIGGAVAGTTALAGGFLLNKDKEEEVSEIEKAQKEIEAKKRRQQQETEAIAKPVYEHKPIVREEKELVTEIKREEKVYVPPVVPQTTQIEKEIKEPPKAELSEERSILDVLSENVVDSEEEEVKPKKKRSSALYWVLPLLLLSLLAVLVLQVQQNKIDFAGLFKSDKTETLSSNAGESNDPVAVSGEEAQSKIEGQQNNMDKAATSEGSNTIVGNTDEEASENGEKSEDLVQASDNRSDTEAGEPADQEEETGDLADEAGVERAPAAGNMNNDAQANAGKSDPPKSTSFDSRGMPIGEDFEEGEERKDPSVRTGTKAGGLSSNKTSTDNYEIKTAGERPTGYFSGIGMFGDRGNALKLKDKMRKQGQEAYVIPHRGLNAVAIFAGTSKDAAKVKHREVRERFQKDAWLKFFK